VTLFVSIYRQYSDFVWASVRRLGVSPAAVDDVVQEIFMVIHSRLHTLEHPEALRSWIYGVVRRVVSSHFRAQRVKSDFGAKMRAEPEAPSPPTPFDLAEQSDQVKLLWRILGELDEAKREVLVMVELDGLTVPEVAEILQITLSNAYWRLRTARQAFDEALARCVPPSERRGGSCCV